MSLLVIGTLAYDTVETVHDKRDEALGGSAMYFSVAASSFVAPKLVAVIGTDFQDAHLQDLKDRGIDTGGVEIAEGKTFRWGGRYEADWNTRHTTFTDLNVFEHFDPKVPEGYKDSEFVFLANAHPKIQLDALKQVNEGCFSVADTMNLWIDIAHGELLELLKHVDGVIMNDEEARLLTGESNLISAAEKVMELGPNTVIVKKGEHGAFIMRDGEMFALPAYPVRSVVDPTGAGDCFAGGFMGAVARAGNTESTTLRQAMLHGTVASSFCVQGFSIEDLGGRSADELSARYSELHRMIDPD